jgi:arginase family enzyme
MPRGSLSSGNLLHLNVEAGQLQSLAFFMREFEGINVTGRDVVEATPAYDTNPDLPTSTVVDVLYDVVNLTVLIRGL